MNEIPKFTREQLEYLITTCEHGEYPCDCELCEKAMWDAIKQEVL